MRNERFDELVNLFLDKEISESELAELSELARSDEALKAELVNRYRLHQAMLYSAGCLSEREMRDSREADFESIIHHPVNLVSFAAAGSYLAAAAVAVVVVGMALVASQSDTLSNEVPFANPANDSGYDRNINVVRVLTAQDQMERFRLAEIQAMEATREFERAAIEVEPFVLQAAPFTNSGFQLIGSPQSQGAAGGGNRGNLGLSQGEDVFLRSSGRRSE